MCAWVRVLVSPHHSWLGFRVCAVGFGFLACAPPFLAGVLGCVWLCAFSSRTPPLLAGVCGVGVCAWARVSAAPRHSCLGCWGVCVFVCVLRLYPATPGWGVRCGCLCLGSGFGCAPQLLARVLGCFSVCGRAPPLPRHSWLVGAVWVCVLGVGFSGSPRHSWLGCWRVCVFVCDLRLYPAIPGWGVRCGCVCFALGFGCPPPLLAGLLRCVCVCGRALLVPRHSWLGCAVWVCVSGLGFRLRHATPGWGIRVCVLLCARSACTSPLLAGLCGVGVCAWGRVSGSPCHSCLGCWVVFVFVGALRLYPATPGWGVRCGCVCLGSGFGCPLPLLAGVSGCFCVCGCVPLVPRHSWLGCAVWTWVLGLGFGLRPATRCWGVPVCVCVCVRAPLVPRDSWLGCAVWVCVLGLGFWDRPATPGWVVGMCVCLWASSACTPPLLAGVCGVGVGAWARVLAAPRLSWLGFWGMCALVGALCLYPASPGWGVRCGCVCLDSGFGCAPPDLARVLGCVCVCGRALLGPRHSWLECAVLVCALGSGFGCAPPFLAGVLGCVCVCVRVLLVPCHSWLRCAVWVCVLGLGFRLRPATPGWGVGVCLCLCARSACTAPLLAGVCGVGLGALARVSAAPRHPW